MNNRYMFDTSVADSGYHRSSRILTKSAFGDPKKMLAAGWGAGAGATVPLVKWLLGTIALGVPITSAYLGHLQEKARENTKHDIDFERRVAKLKDTDRAISALRSENII